MKMKLNHLLDEDMALLEEKGNLITYTRDQTILSERAINRKIYYIRKGNVRIELSRLYRGIVIANIGAGNLFGEISFLIDDHTSATVVANNEVEVLEVDGDVMDELLTSNDKLAARFYHSLAAILAQRLRVQSHAN